MVVMIGIAIFTIQDEPEEDEEPKESEEERELREFTETIDELSFLTEREKKKVVTAWKKKREQESQEQLERIQNQREQSSNNTSNNQREETKYERESIDYVIQRLGGSGWLGESSGWSNVSSAIDSADSLKRRNPNNRYRVAERSNGRITGTVYSC